MRQSLYRCRDPRLALGVKLFELFFVVAGHWNDAIVKSNTRKVFVVRKGTEKMRANPSRDTQEFWRAIFACFCVEVEVFRMFARDLF